MGALRWLVPVLALSAGSSRAQAVPVVESSGAVWNAVAVSGRRIFLSGPRWGGSSLPPLVEAAVGTKRFLPFPDAAWNGWAPTGGAPPANAFVSINALRLEGGRLWVVDTGTPAFGANPLPGGPKLVGIELASGKVFRKICFGPDVALPGSYLDDVRFNGKRAYLTDAGQPGLVVVDLESGSSRRVLNGHPSTVATPGRPIVLDGKAVMGPDGKQLRVNADPLEVSPDGAWLYYGSLHGPWVRVPTRLLDEPTTPSETLAAAVQPWLDLPPTGGTAMDRKGNLYFSDLASNSVRRRSADGHFSMVAKDHRLHWVDAPFLADDGFLWFPAAQLDRVPLLNGGKSEVQEPMTVFKVKVPKGMK